MITFSDPVADLTALDRLNAAFFVLLPRIKQHAHRLDRDDSGYLSPAHLLLSDTPK